MIDADPFVMRVDMARRSRWIVRGAMHKGCAGATLAVAVWRSVAKDITRRAGTLVRV